jgi:hypothetical protein
VKGDISDKTALVNAMINVDMSNNPAGPIKMDPTYHAAISNVYIRDVAKASDNSLYNKGLWTVTNVSQFGPYDPKTYMAQPADSNKYPPDDCSAFPPEMLKDTSPYQFVPFGQ